jgi:hypothetical protein
MQKSAQPAPMQPQPRSTRFEPPSDKGQKFEPFYVPATGRDRRSVARDLRLDQRR